MQEHAFIVQPPVFRIDNLTRHFAAAVDRTGVVQHINALTVDPQLVKIPANMMGSQRIKSFITQLLQDGIRLHSIRQIFAKLLRRGNTVYLIHIQHPVAVLYQQCAAIIARFTNGNFNVVHGVLIEIALHQLIRHGRNFLPQHEGQPVKHMPLCRSQGHSAEHHGQHSSNYDRTGGVAPRSADRFLGRFFHVSLL